MNSHTESGSSAWTSVERQIETALAEVRVLPLDTISARGVLERLGVSDRSTMGALASHVGALLVDHGWLRVLGGGSGSIPGIADVNHLDGSAPPFLIVAEDVLGGRFAIDGGGLEIAVGEVCYFGPDTLEWTGIGGGYSAYISWLLSGGLAEFYSGLRWDGWEQDALGLRLDQGISLYPPPFTAEGRAPTDSSRRPVPLAELHGFYSDATIQLASLGDGNTFRFSVDVGDNPA